MLIGIFVIVLVVIVVKAWGEIGPFSLAFGTMAGVLACLFASILMMPFSKDVVQTHQLTSLSDGSGTRGSFFLGSGSVSSSPVFFYYQTNADGGSTLEYEYAEDATVYQTENENPYMEQECDSYEHIPEFINYPVGPLFGETDCYGDIRFYVPEGSIQANYILDAE